MNIQFIFEANKVNIQTTQVLPKVFNKTLFTGSKALYLTHNNGRKHKVYIKKMPKETKYALYSYEWKDFLNDSGYVNVDTFHFIREGENEFYVTAYHSDGTECNGNNLYEAYGRQRRFLVTLEHIEESPIIPDKFFSILAPNQILVMVANVIISVVAKRIIKLSKDRQGHVLSGPGWHVLVEREHLQPQNRLVFTNIWTNEISVMPFADNGVGLRSERVPRMELNEEFPFFYRAVEFDPRMKHICYWDDHNDYHNDEKNTFHAPILAYVIDAKRLTIPSWFVTAYKLIKYKNAILRFKKVVQEAPVYLDYYVDLVFVCWRNRPKRKNHIKITAPWKEIVRQCEFFDNKWVRFKLIEFIPDLKATLNPLAPVMIPLFHMC